MFLYKKNMLRGSFICAALLFFLVASVYAAEEDIVLARVNGLEIRKSDFMRELVGLPPQLADVPMQKIYPQILDRIIYTRLLVAEGQTGKLNEAPEFKERVKRFEERLLADNVVKAKIKPQMTEEKLKGLYQAAVKNGPDEEEARVRHIMVGTEKDALDIIAQLGNGGDFEKMAADKSIDRATALRGGDLGYFVKKTMAPAIADAAFAMKVGEVSKTPVKTASGFHVLKLEDKRKVALPSYEKLKPQLEASLYDQLANAQMNATLKDAKIERFNMDGTPLLPAPAAETKK